jgi:hypothetical protein
MSEGSFAKTAICRVLIMLPVALWSLATRIVHAIWPGFKRA